MKYRDKARNKDTHNGEGLEPMANRKWQYEVGQWVMVRTDEGSESLKVLKRIVLPGGQRAYKMEFGYLITEKKHLTI